MIAIVEFSSFKFCNGCNGHFLAATLGQSRDQDFLAATLTQSRGHKLGAHPKSFDSPANGCGQKFLAATLTQIRGQIISGRDV